MEARFGRSGFIALSNVTDGEMQVTVQPVGPGDDAQLERALTLTAHSTQMLHLDELAANPSTLAKQAGGVRVQYTGQPGAVQVTGGLENDAQGYSANIPFWGHDMSSSSPGQITYASAGLMVGKPDPMMMPGFPKETTLRPYLVLRNTTEKPLDVSLQLNYMTGTDGSSPVTRNLPRQHLGPSLAKQVDMPAILNSVGLKNFSGSINLSVSFAGRGGDLVLATGSVDQTGTYVFEVEPQGVGSSRSKFANYWSVANGNDTMFSLWNPTGAAQDILATFYYGDGSGEYTLPVHLAPQASTMIDMAMLIAENKPDSQGNAIPSNIQEGSAQFLSTKGKRDKITLVLAGGVFNVSTATCGSTCINCCGDSNFGISPNPIYCPLGQSMQCGSTAVDCNGYSVFPSSWSSSNTAVMTVNSSGVVTGASAGQATITAYYTGVVIYTGQLCSPNPYCPISSPAPTAPGNVQVPTSLSIVQGTDSTPSEAPCTTGGLAGCGVTRTFKYQVNDQNGQPIRASMPFGDVICNTSTNQLNLQSYDTTCGGMTGSCWGTRGPCGQYTDSMGQFNEKLTVCAPACKPSGTCTTAGQTIANQTWTIGGTQLTSDVKSISYQCNKILVNGQ